MCCDVTEEGNISNDEGEGGKEKEKKKKKLKKKKKVIYVDASCLLCKIIYCL